MIPPASKAPSAERLPTLPGQLRFWQWFYSLGLCVGTWGIGLLAWLIVLDDVPDLSGLWLLWTLAPSLLLAAWGWYYAKRCFAAYQAEYHPQQGVVLRSGVWWQTEEWLPVARLQHVDVSHGPWDRAHGMATLSLHTAGTHDHRLRIRGLPRSPFLRGARCSGASGSRHWGSPTGDRRRRTRRSAGAAGCCTSKTLGRATGRGSTVSDWGGSK